MIDNHSLKGIPINGLRPVFVQVGLFVDAFGLADLTNALFSSRALVLFDSWEGGSLLHHHLVPFLMVPREGIPVLIVRNFSSHWVSLSDLAQGIGV